MSDKSFEVTLKYIVEAPKASTSFTLSDEVAKIIDGGEISTQSFGQTFAFDMRATLFFVKNDASWSIRIVEKKTKRELWIENRKTGQYSFNSCKKGEHFSFISKEPSILPKYKSGYQSWGLRTRALYIFKTKNQLAEIKEEIEEQVNFHQSFSTCGSLSRNRYINPGSLYAWPRADNSKKTSSPNSPRSLTRFDALDNKSYDVSTGSTQEANNHNYVAAYSQAPPRRFFSEPHSLNPAQAIHNLNYLEDTAFSSTNDFYLNSSESNSSHGQIYPLTGSSESSTNTKTSLSKTNGSCEDGGYLQAVPHPAPKVMTTASIELSIDDEKIVDEADNLNYSPGSHLTESECSNSRGESVKQHRSKTLPTKSSFHE
ncbi:unnamed protein product [Oikopleura dioica]|uniref:Uncharacterized protein n=1 Tax=Oikopleura dioica TaxID=34765 RepID=E4YBL9_OIKDI|nr:unnamed protein product [Oikopleura dioica]